MTNILQYRLQFRSIVTPIANATLHCSPLYQFQNYSFWCGFLDREITQMCSFKVYVLFSEESVKFNLICLKIVISVLN